MKRLLAIALLLLSAACGRRQPNIVLITLDNARADHIGYATSRPGLTPNLDAVAAKGAWFSTCIAASPLTEPSVVTILTGQYPYHHGVRNAGTFTLSKDVATVAQQLQAAGYQTEAVVSVGDPGRQTGLDRGFDSFGNSVRTVKPKPDAAGRTKVAAAVDESTDGRAVHWLNNSRKKTAPFFLWVDFQISRASNGPPEEDALLFPDDPYSASIHYADRQLGQVVDTLKADGLWDDTIFIFVTAHGESLGEHGESSHGIFLYDSTTRVPLLFAGHEIESRRIDSLARTADIAPTILDLAGVGKPRTHFDGASLVPILSGGRDDGRVAYSESLAPRLDFGWSELRSERTLATRVVAAPKAEVYNEKSDPGELTNLIASAPPSEEVRRMLADLQRLGAADPFFRGTAAGGPLPDPKDRIAFIGQSAEVAHLLAAHSYLAAGDELRRILASDPKNPVALTELGAVSAITGRPDDAIRFYEEALAVEPGQIQASVGVLELLRKEGRFAEAEPLAHKLVGLHPQDASAWIALGDLLADMGRLPDAESTLRKATQIDPRSAKAIASLANVLAREKKEPEAIALLEAARKNDPQSRDIVYNLGLVYDGAGKRDEAEAAYRESVSLDPRHSLSWNNLGSLLDREGRRAEAIEDIRKAHELDPLNTEATYNLGALLLASDHAADGLPLLQQAARERPALVQGQIELAAALQAVGKNDEAIAILRRLSVTQPAALLRVAMIEWGEGNHEAARRDLGVAESRGGAPVTALIRRTPALGRIAQDH